MKQSVIKQIKADVATFADDMDEVYIQGNGELTYQRMGNIVSVKLAEKNNQSACIICDGVEYEYIDFLATKLADLRSFAKKIIQKDDSEEESDNTQQNNET